MCFFLLSIYSMKLITFLFYYTYFRFCLLSIILNYYEYGEIYTEILIISLLIMIINI